MTLTAPNTPITLPAGDGMVLFDRTETAGGVEVITWHNPRLIAAAKAERTMRALVRETNLRRFS